MHLETYRLRHNPTTFTLHAKPDQVQWNLARKLLNVVYSLRKNPAACCKSGIYLHVDWSRSKDGKLNFDVNVHLQPTFGQLSGQVIPVREDLGSPRQTAELLAQLIADFEPEGTREFDFLFAWRIPHLGC